MADITWPLTIQPNSMSMYLKTLSTVFTNPYTNQTQVLERNGQRWVASMSFVKLAADARRVDALLAALRGPAGAVLIPDFRTPTALNNGLLGSPMLTGGSGRTVTVTDLNAPLMPGDMIQTSPGRGHIVVEETATGAGPITVKIEPVLREAVTTGPLVTSNVRIRMRLPTDDETGNPTTPPRVTRYELNFVEILPGLDE